MKLCNTVDITTAAAAAATTTATTTTTTTTADAEHLHHNTNDDDDVHSSSSAQYVDAVSHSTSCSNGLSNSSQSTVASGGATTAAAASPRRVTRYLLPDPPAKRVCQDHAASPEFVSVKQGSRLSAGVVISDRVTEAGSPHGWHTGSLRDAGGGGDSPLPSQSWVADTDDCEGAPSSLLRLPKQGLWLQKKRRRDDRSTPRPTTTSASPRAAKAAPAPAGDDVVPPPVFPPARGGGGGGAAAPLSPAASVRRQRKTEPRGGWTGGGPLVAFQQQTDRPRMLARGILFDTYVEARKNAGIKLLRDVLAEQRTVKDPAMAERSVFDNILNPPPPRPRAEKKGLGWLVMAAHGYGGRPHPEVRAAKLAWIREQDRGSEEKTTEADRHAHGYPMMDTHWTVNEGAVCAADVAYCDGWGVLCFTPAGGAGEGADASAASLNMSPAHKIAEDNAPAAAASSGRQRRPRITTGDGSAWRTRLALMNLQKTSLTTHGEETAAPACRSDEEGEAGGEPRAGRSTVYFQKVDLSKDD